MIKLLALLHIILLTSCSNASLECSPMLWKIEGKGLHNTSYIFGTFHTKDKSINMLPLVVVSSLQKVQRFYGEIQMTKRDIQLIARYTKLSSPLALHKRLKPKTISSISKYLKDISSSIKIKNLSIFKTWAISFILSNQEEQMTYPNRLFMDEKLANIAKRANIKQGGLETAVEQLLYFEKLTQKEQELLIILSIKQATDLKYKTALTKWYKRGEAKGFFEIQKKFRLQNIQLKKLEQILTYGLLTERNSRFVRRMDILLQNKVQHSYFFAIGAGHLAGEDGILAQLRLKGYKINRVHK